MKYMNMRRFKFDLQLFSDEGDAGDGGDTGGDDQDDDDSDEGGEDEEKKFTQKDVDDAVKNRLAREKRRWQRELKKETSSDDNKPDADNKDKDKPEDKEIQKIRDKAQKAEELELKWTCLEHDVDVKCVDDVLALAQVHMAKDKDLDIEDAIDKVLEKYPNLKNGGESDDDEGDKKGWGQRHGKTTKKATTVEDAISEKLFGK